jgi:transposase-like protein
MSARNQGSEGPTSGKRRRWTTEQKRQIVAEGLEPGVSVAMVARKHGISSGQYYAWRQQLLLGGALGTVPDTMSSLVRVEVTTVSCLAAASPALLERGIPAMPIAPTLPGEPDADIVGPDGIYSAHAKTRKSLGEMTRKLLETASQ